MAREILEGFGDALLGEWTESRPIAFHLRRRLSIAEQNNIGEARDCRNTAEGQRRFEKIAEALHPMAVKLALEELEAKP